MINLLFELWTSNNYSTSPTTKSTTEFDGMMKRVVEGVMLCQSYSQYLVYIINIAHLNLPSTYHAEVLIEL